MHKTRVKSLKVVTLGIIIINLFSFKLYSQELSKSDQKYKKHLISVISDINKNQFISLNKIEKSIPQSESEYRIYYESTYPDRSEVLIRSFYKLDSIIIENAKLNRLNFTKKVIRMVNFVDGEYAESYFNDLENIVELNSSCFCKMYTKLSSEAIDSLDYIINKYCK